MNRFLAQGWGVGDRYKSSGIIASRCCLPSSLWPCVFQRLASSSELNQGVSPRAGAGPSGFKQLRLRWLLISPHLLATGAVLCGRGSGCARGLWLSGFCQPSNSGPVRTAKCCRTGDTIRNWQRWLHCARQAALPDPCRRRLPPLRPASPQPALPRDACAVNTVLLGIWASLQRASLLAVVLVIIYWLLMPNNVSIWLAQSTCCSCNVWRWVFMHFVS